MEVTQRHENYPIRMVIISGLNSLLIYALGFLILWQAGRGFSLAYMVYVMVLEYRLMKYSCTSCYYWGKTCAFGRGRLSALFFPKGDPGKFCSRKITYKDLIPDMMVFLLPLGVGIILLILSYSLFLLLTLPLLAVLATAATGLLRSHIACRYCMQKDSGCPAQEFFKNKTG